MFLLLFLLIGFGIFAVRFIVIRYNGLQMLSEGVREAHSTIIASMKIHTNLFVPTLGFRPAPYFNVEDADSLEGP